MVGGEPSPAFKASLIFGAALKMKGEGKLKKIYLAIPYTHKKKSVMQRRFGLANKITADLIRDGNFVYSPISSSHPLVKYGLPVEWDFWFAFDESFIEWADELHVVMADGWKQSKGVKAEIEIAEKLGKAVVFIEIEKTESMSWAIRQRLWFIDNRLAIIGFVNRGDLCDAFGISFPQASSDIKKYISIAPGNAEYDTVKKRYRASGVFKRHFSEMPA